MARALWPTSTCRQAFKRLPMRQNSTTYPTIRWRISGVVHEQEVGKGDNLWIHPVNYFADFYHKRRLT